MDTSKSLRIAFIGAGYMASEHLKAFSSCPQAKLVGIYSRDKKRAEVLTRKYEGLEVFSSLEDLYLKTNANLVVIAVPELACKSVCEKAFRYPWTILVEKPVGYNFSQALEIERISAEFDAKVYVALNRRFYGSTFQLEEFLRNNNGQRLVTILDQEDAAGALIGGQPPEVVANWMYANSIHLIDYFSQLCRGDHLSTEILTPWNPKAPGPVVAYLKFSSGDIGLYQAVWDAPGPWSVSICTKNIRAELRPLEQLTIQRVGSRTAEIQPSDPLDKNYKPGLLRQAQEAIKAAQGITTALPSLEEANRSMALVASIYEMK